MILGDAGSSWCKIYESGASIVRVLPTTAFASSDRRLDWGTGHTARGRSARFENDLISLSRGALALVDEEDFTILDLGSRDAKLVVFSGRRPTRLDWSVGCAAATGATLEMIGRFYRVDFDRLAIDDEWTPLTCGTYALERIMDAVSVGGSLERAISRFVHGVARSAFDFAGRPSRLFLSGGFTANRAFLEALGRYCSVVSLGRAVPLAGLWAFAADEDPSIGPVPTPLARGVCAAADLPA